LEIPNVSGIAKRCVTRATGGQLEKTPSSLREQVPVRDLPGVRIRALGEQAEERFDIKFELESGKSRILVSGEIKTASAIMVEGLFGKCWLRRQAGMTRDQKIMPDVPTPDFVGAVSEIWLTVNAAAYHLAYTRVYLQTRAMQTPVDELREDDQSARDQSQVDLIICRSHLAAFFWQLHHVLEALESAIRRGKNEYPNERYFYSEERKLESIRQSAIPKEIDAYRSEGAQRTGDYRPAMQEKGGKFLHHFLPSIEGHQPKESIDLNKQLQTYFEYVVNLWLSFVPEHMKSKFPRSFRFPVTVPFFHLGDLPAEFRGLPQLEIFLEACERPIAPEVPTEPQREDSPGE
jgi:hypothetical protein